MRINGSSIYSSVQLGEGNVVPNQVQILRVGKFNHPTYGYFEISEQTLSEMKKNFDSNIRGIDMSFDYFHDSHKDASAWVESLELRENNTELWALVKWTPKAAQKLAERELRYFSPDFSFEWEDPEKSIKYNNVLFGGGLTNRPFVKEMRPIVAAEKKGEDQMNLEQTQAALKDAEAKNVKLSEEKSVMEKQMADMAPKSSIQELEAKIAQLQAELAKAKEAEGKMLEEKKKLEEEKCLAEKKGKFAVLLSEGKAVAAQEKSYLAGNMEEFISLSEKVNLKPNGTSNTAEHQDDDVKAILKLAEEKMSKDKSLSKGDAISLAKKELKK